MTRKLLFLLGLGALSPSAMAAGFQAKTMRESLSAREVERPLLIGKGWLEFGVGLEMKNATQYWSDEGEKIDFAPGSEWTYTTERLDIRYGFARRGELYWTVKTHYVHLTNEELKTDIEQFGLGDPNFGLRYELFRSTATPMTSVIAYGDYKAPAANESPGNYVGGPSTFSAVVLTTGTPDVTVGLAAKKQVGPAAVTLDAAYVRRMSGVVQYLIETELNQFSGRIKPGDLVRVEGDLLLQVGPVALNGGATLTRRDETLIGNTSEGLFMSDNMYAVEGSDGVAIDGNAGATFNITRGVDFIARATIPVKGEDLLFWPIEDIHPTLGNTYSGTVEFRY